MDRSRRVPGGPQEPFACRAGFRFVTIFELDVVPATVASMIVGLSTATTRKEAPAMAGADRMTIEEVVKQVMVREHGDVVRAALEAVCRELMEGEASELVGAELGERRPDDRMTHRNGYRAREWQTRAGTVELQIPKLRRGSYFPSFLEPRRRSEQALLSVVQQAYVCGVSTRRVGPARREPRPARFQVGGLADLPGA